VSNERPDLCAACGECCRTRPGAEAPERFLGEADPAGALASALASGDWVLARHVGRAWDGDAPPPDPERWRTVRYPRPATLRERGTRAAEAGAGGSPCVYLDPGGCRLPFEARPRMCRELEPWANGECEATWDLPHAARAWAPWQGLIDDALRRVLPER
jgi:Fe-S-cluster containining protein